MKAKCLIIRNFLKQMRDNVVLQHRFCDCYCRKSTKNIKQHETNKEIKIKRCKEKRALGMISKVMGC